MIANKVGTEDIIHIGAFGKLKVTLPNYASVESAKNLVTRAKVRHPREDGLTYTCKIDKKTNLITIDVTMQDPYVAAQLADSVKNRLQDFLTAYRTKKARHDLEYALTLNRQARKDYERARLLYSEYMDANQDMILLSAKQKQNDLENEMQLQYNNFTATSAQVLAAKALVQKETPSFTTIQSATVPLGPAGPNTRLIMLACLFLAALGTTIYALYKEDQLKPLLGLS